MKNKDYAMVQIPKPAYDLLKAYCTKNDKIMGKFIASMIHRECSDPVIPKGPVLRVNN